MVTRERETRWNTTKLAAGSTVHAAARSELSGYAVLYCNGRAMSGMVATSEPVTCKACKAAGATGGMGPYA